MNETRVFVLDDGDGTAMLVGEIGAAWLSCRVPMRNGTSREVLLGPPAPPDLRDQSAYLGVVVGRYANRIARARFAIGDRTYRLEANEGPHHLHGGPDGFDKRKWTLISHTAREVQLGLGSPDGDQGYPGNLEARVTYKIAGPGRIRVNFDAAVDAPCPVSLTSHAYFNLDGAETDAPSIRAHHFRLRASRYLPVDESLIPTGEWAPVDGTRFDLRTLQTLGAQDFDHCFVLDGGAGADAEVWSADRRLRMRLRTDYPGLQFYTGEHLGGVRGRHGASYPEAAGFALEPQFPPDAPNHPEWPCGECVLRPGRRLQAHLDLQFEAVDF